MEVEVLEISSLKSKIVLNSLYFENYEDIKNNMKEI